MLSTIPKGNVSVLELQLVPSDILGCYGPPLLLDQIASTASLVIRVAEDELLLIGEHSRQSQLDRDLTESDPPGLLVNLSSAFSVWAVKGDDRFEAFCRLSDLQLPCAPNVTQGLVARVPAKVVVKDEELLIIVSSVLSHHLRNRVLGACSDLSPEETAAHRVKSAEEQVTLA
jgi:hypothetical protein